MFQVEDFLAVLYIVSESWVADRDAIFTPLQPCPIDGLHRINGPASQVSVELGLGLLWYVSLWERWFVIGEKTCSMRHLHTDGDLAVLLGTETSDSTRQHSSIRPDELTEQQDICVVVFVLQVPSVDGALGCGVGWLWSGWSILC